MLSPPTISHTRLFQPWQPSVSTEPEIEDQTCFIELPKVTSYLQLLDKPVFQDIRTQFLRDIVELKHLAHRYVSNQFDKALDAFHNKLCEPPEYEFEDLPHIYRETRFQIHQLVLKLRHHSQDQCCLSHRTDNDYFASLLCECLNGIDLCLAGVHSRFATTFLDLQAVSANGLDDRLYKARSDLFRTFVHSFMVEQQQTGLRVSEDMEVHWFNGLHNLYCDNLALHSISDPLAHDYLNDDDLTWFLNSVRVSVNACTVLRRIANDWSGQLIATLASVGCSHWLTRPAGIEENTAIGVNALNSKVFGPINGLMGTVTDNPINLTVVMDDTIDDSFHLKRHREKMFAWLTGCFYRADTVVFAGITGGGRTVTYIGTINQLYFWVFQSAQPLHIGQKCVFTPTELISLQLPHLHTIDFSTWPELTAHALLTQALEQTTGTEDIAAFFLSPVVGRQLRLLPSAVVEALTAQLRDKLVDSDAAFQDALRHHVCSCFASALRTRSGVLAVLNSVDWLIKTPLLQPVLSQLQGIVDITPVTAQLNSWEIAEFSPQQIAELLTPEDCQRLFLQAFRLGQTELVVNLLLTGHCQETIRRRCQTAGQRPDGQQDDSGGLIYLQSLVPADINHQDDSGRVLLHHTVLGGYLQVVRVLLKLPGIDVNVRDNEGHTPLFLAVQNNQNLIVNAMVKTATIDVNMTDFAGVTSLQLAALIGNLAILHMLLAAPGIELNSRDSLGFTPLLSAACENHPLCVKALVETAGVDVNVSNNTGWTPLCSIAQFGYVECLKVMLASKAVQVNLATYKSGWTPLFCAAEQNRLECLKILLARPDVDVNAATSNGASPLHITAAHGFDQCLQELLKRPEIEVNRPSIDGATPLHNAASRNRWGCLKLLLNHKGVQVNAVAKDGATALNASASMGYIECVRLLLGIRDVDLNHKSCGWSPCVKALVETAGVDVNVSNNTGWTPLCSIAQFGYVECLKVMLASKAVQVNLATYKSGWTPLFCAAEQNRLECLKILLARPDVDVNAATSNGASPLHITAAHGFDQCLQELLKRPEIEVNRPSIDGATPLHNAASRNRWGCLKLLLNHKGVQVNAVAKDGATALNASASMGYIECVRLLLGIRDVDLNHKSCGWSPLNAAVKGNHPVIVNALLGNSGVDVNTRNDIGQTPLHNAVLSGLLECTTFLLEAPGIDLNAVSNSGHTPLNMAAHSGSFLCLKALIYMGIADVNLPAYDGMTPLHSAVQGNHRACVAALVKVPGIDVNKETILGVTALELAAKLGHFLCMEELLAAPGIRLNQAARFGNLPPLHRAVFYGFVGCVQLLSKTPGVDINGQCHRGFTPLHIAASRGHLDCLQVLLATPGIEINRVCRQGFTPEQIAIKNDHSVCAVAIFQAKEAAACLPCSDQSSV